MLNVHKNHMAYYGRWGGGGGGYGRGRGEEEDYIPIATLGQTGSQSLKSDKLHDD